MKATPLAGALLSGLIVALLVSSGALRHRYLPYGLAEKEEL